MATPEQDRALAARQAMGLMGFDGDAGIGTSITPTSQMDVGPVQLEAPRIDIGNVASTMETGPLTIQPDIAIGDASIKPTIGAEIGDAVIAPGSQVNPEQPAVAAPPPASSGGGGGKARPAGTSEVTEAKGTLAGATKDVRSAANAGKEALGAQADVAGAIGDEKSLALGDTQARTAELGAKFQGQLDEGRVAMADADTRIKDAQAELKAMGPPRDQRDGRNMAAGIIAMAMGGVGDILAGFAGGKAPEYMAKAQKNISDLVDRSIQQQLMAKGDKKDEITGLTATYARVKDKMASDTAAYEMLRSRELEDLKLNLQGVDLSHASEAARATRDMQVAAVDQELAVSAQKYGQEAVQGAQGRANAVKITGMNNAAAQKRQDTGNTFEASQKAEDRQLEENIARIKAKGEMVPVGTKVPGGGFIKDPSVYGKTTPAQQNDFAEKTQARQQIVEMAGKYAEVLSKRTVWDSAKSNFILANDKNGSELERIREAIGLAVSKAEKLGAYDNGTKDLMNDLTGKSMFTSRTNETLQNLSKRQATAAGLDARTLGLGLDPDVLQKLQPLSVGANSKARPKE